MPALSMRLLEKQKSQALPQIYRNEIDISIIVSGDFYAHSCLRNTPNRYQKCRHSKRAKEQMGKRHMKKMFNIPYYCSAVAAAAAAAKSLQSCPTLCDPIGGSPPGSPVPGILQARTLEWVAISFSNA